MKDKFCFLVSVLFAEVVPGDGEGFNAGFFHCVFEAFDPPFVWYGVLLTLNAGNAFVAVFEEVLRSHYSALVVIR